MAWVNVPLTIFDIPQATVTDFTWCDNPVVGNQGGDAKISITWKFANECGQQKNLYVLGNNTGYGLYVDTPDEQAYVNDYYQYNMLLDGQPQSPPWGQYVGIKKSIGGYNTRLGFIAVINEETQKGIFVLLNQKGGTLSNWTFATGKITGSQVPSNPIAGGNRVCYDFIKGLMPPTAITSNGGGATHIAKRAGLLSSIGASNLSDILMVSGGGGGGLIIGEDTYAGKDAGGISGSGDNSADQTTGNAFGLGENGTNLSGGGSGLYGGYKGTSSKSGGAGSGYIGNTLVSNKKMVGYNVPTSSAESTKTESVNEASESPVSGKPKIGNGFARIKLVKQLYTLGDIAKANNLTNVQSVTGLNNISGLSQYFLTNNILYTQEINDTYSNRMESFDGEECVGSGKYGKQVSYQGGGYKYEQTGFMCYIPIQRTTITKLELKLKFDIFCGGSDADIAKEWNFVKFGFGKVENGNMVSSGWVIETTYAQVKNTLSNYINLSISLSEPFTADYFVLLGYDGVFHFKDVLLFSN